MDDEGCGSVRCCIGIAVAFGRKFKAAVQLLLLLFGNNKVLSLGVDFQSQLVYRIHLKVVISVISLSAGYVKHTPLALRLCNEVECSQFGPVCV